MDENGKNRLKSCGRKGERQKTVCVRAHGKERKERKERKCHQESEKSTDQQPTG